MNTLSYWRVDVFTEVPFGGNPLAVVPEADELGGDEMKKIAREMNLPETCFVVKSSDAHAKYRFRLFTAAAGLPMSGDPEVGAHFVLATRGYYELTEPKTRVYHEIGGGRFPADIYVREGNVERVMITLSPPQFHQTVQEVDDVAKAIGVETQHITSSKLPIQLVSAGLEQMIIPMSSLQAMQSIEPVPKLLKKLARKYSTSVFCPFTRETVDEGSSVHSRLLTAGIVPSEDPASGTASGALAAYVVRYKLVDAFRTIHVVNEQGYEIGRPSKVYVEIDTEEGFASAVRVGGHVVPVAEGKLFL